MLGQAAAALLAAAGVWYCWRRGPRRLGVAALLCGCFLATPYAFFYDLPLLAGALVALLAERVEARAAFTLAEVPVLLGAAMLAGLIVKANAGVPWGLLVLPALFALIVVRSARCAPAR